MWLTGSHIMLAQWWQWSAQATAQTTGQLCFKYLITAKPLEWIRSLTKIRTATYAKTYPGAVYTAIEVGIISLQRKPTWQAKKQRWLSTHTMWKTSATKRTSPWWVWMGTQPSMLTATWFGSWYSFLRLASGFCKWLAGCFTFGKVTLWYISPFQIKLDRDIRFLKKKVQPICLPSKILAQAGYTLT